MQIALFGATGVVGTQLVKELLNKSDVTQILLLTRRQTNFSQERKVSEIIIPEMSKEKILQLDIKAEHFLCTLGTTIKKAKSKELFKHVDHDLVESFALLCKSSKGKSFHVVSSLGSDRESLFFYNKVKGEMEETIERLNLPSTYVYRPSLLISNRKEIRVGEKIGILSVKFIRPFVTKRISRYMGTNVNELASKIVSNLDNTENGFHRIEADQIF